MCSAKQFVRNTRGWGRSVADAPSIDTCVARYADFRDLTSQYSQSDFHQKRLTTLVKYVRRCERVLDVGCNVGYLAGYLPHCEVHGVDPSRVAIEIAKTRLVSAHVGCAERLPFPDKSMDVVVLGYVLERVFDPLAVLREAARVARRLVVGDTPHPDSGMWGRHTIAGSPYDIRSYDRQELYTLLQRIGWQVQVNDLRLGDNPGMWTFVVNVDVPTVALVMETKDRTSSPHGGVNFLGDTLGNLGRSGAWDSPHLKSFSVAQDDDLSDAFWAEYIPLMPEGTVIDAMNRGRRSNALRAIQLGAVQDVDWVITIEDDIDFVDDFLNGAVTWLEEHKHLDAVMWALGSAWGETVTPVNTALYVEDGESVMGFGKSFPYARKALARGENYLHNKGYWGGQCLAWPRMHAVSLARWFEEHLLDPDIGGKDVLLQKWGQSLRSHPFCTPVPSFVQHVGRQSYMGTTFFEFPWPGREWRYLGSGR